MQLTLWLELLKLVAFRDFDTHADKCPAFPRTMWPVRRQWGQMGNRESGSRAPIGIGPARQSSLDARAQTSERAVASSRRCIDISHVTTLPWSGEEDNRPFDIKQAVGR